MLPVEFWFGCWVHWIQEMPMSRLPMIQFCQNSWGCCLTRVHKQQHCSYQIFFHFQQVFQSSLWQIPPVCPEVSLIFAHKRPKISCGSKSGTLLCFKDSVFGSKVVTFCPIQWWPLSPFKTFSACLCEHFCFFSSSLDLLPTDSGWPMSEQKAAPANCASSKISSVLCAEALLLRKRSAKLCLNLLAGGTLGCKWSFALLWNMFLKSVRKSTKLRHTDTMFRECLEKPISFSFSDSTRMFYQRAILWFFSQNALSRSTQHFFQLVSTCLSSVCQRKTLTLKSCPHSQTKTQLAQTKQTIFFCYKCIPQTFAKPRPKPPVVQDQNLVQHSSQSLVLSAEVSLKLLGLLWVATTAVQHLLCAAAGSNKDKQAK